MKKLTKDQRYYRKLKKDGQKDIRYKDKPEDKNFFRPIRTTRKPISVRISELAYEKLVALSEKLKLDKWQVVNRILLFKLPRYQSNSASESPLQRYEWHYPEPAKKGTYKGSTGDKQITYYISSTAWKKLDCHKVATGKSKAKIVQSLLLDYKPMSMKALEKQKRHRAAIKETRDSYKSEALKVSSSKGNKSESSNKKFWVTSTGEILHKKRIPIDKWDEAEHDLYLELVPYAEDLQKIVIKRQEAMWKMPTEEDKIEEELKKVEDSEIELWESE